VKNLSSSDEVHLPNAPDHMDPWMGQEKTWYILLKFSLYSVMYNLPNAPDHMDPWMGQEKTWNILLKFPLNSVMYNLPNAPDHMDPWIYLVEVSSKQCHVQPS
jgi:hypothetical protein